jgi:hypothetical protein
MARALVIAQIGALNEGAAPPGYPQLLPLHGNRVANHVANSSALGRSMFSNGRTMQKSDRMYDKGREAPLRITLFRDFQFTM